MTMNKHCSVGVTVDMVLCEIISVCRKRLT